MKGVLVWFYYKNLDIKEYYKLEYIIIPDPSLIYDKFTINICSPEDIKQLQLCDDSTFIPISSNTINSENLPVDDIVEKIKNKDPDIINKISEYVKDEFNSKQKHKLEYGSSEPVIGNSENTRICSPCGGGCSNCSACSACSRSFSK